jgi:hypothetical protein
MMTELLPKAAMSFLPARRRPTALLLPVLLSILAVGGCRRSDVELVPVEGRVTCGGGEWPAQGMIYFTPVEAAAGHKLRPAWATFDAEGRFRATSFQPGDGLRPGRYTVFVECWSTPPVMGSTAPPVSCVPDKYQSPVTSGLEVEVKPGERRVRVEWDVPKR